MTKQLLLFIGSAVSLASGLPSVQELTTSVLCDDWYPGGVTTKTQLVQEAVQDGKDIRPVQSGGIRRLWRRG